VRRYLHNFQGREGRSRERGWAGRAQAFHKKPSACSNLPKRGEGGGKVMAFNGRHKKREGACNSCRKAPKSLLRFGQKRGNAQLAAQGQKQREKEEHWGRRWSGNPEKRKLSMP